MSQYTGDTFEPYVGQVFAFEPPTDAHGNRRESVRLELVEILRSRPRGVPGLRDPFTLLFVLRSAEPLGRGLHRLAHEDFEACDWFVNRVMVPGRDARAAYYQAVFA
jgi:hypothetical protein